MAFAAAAQLITCDNCLIWKSANFWIFSLSDLFITIAYYSIPLALLYYVKRKKQLEFQNIYILFAGFLLIAGTYHLINMLTLSIPISMEAQNAARIVTAVVSMVTAVVAWRIMPKALSAPSLRELQILNEKHLNLLNGVLETTVDAFLTLDSHGRILSFNRAAERLFQYKFADVVATQFENLFLHQYDLLIESNMGQTLEVECIRKDQSNFLAELSIAEVWVDNRRHFSAMIRDISGSRAYEEKLNSALHEATEATKAKSHFLANMSHELRTPLNSVIGMAEVMNETSLTKEQQHYVNILLKSGRNLLCIINEILDLSKIEANQLSLEVIEFDIEELTQEVVDLLAIKAHEKGIDLNFYLEPSNTGRYLGDPGRIKQVLINLINNAIKFTKKGEVNVWVKDSKNPEAPVEFTVEDTGIGIDLSKINQIFEDFNQLDSSITREFGGTGLGLSISRKLVDLMGGSISVSSREKRGSLFSFTVRISKIADAKKVADSFDLKVGAKIIIFEENQTAVKILRRLMGCLDCDLIFIDSNELRSIIKSQTFRSSDIFLISIGHDVTTNLRLVNELISFGLSPSRVICALNIDNLNYARIKAHALGIDHFITRPFRLNELSESINHLSDEKAPIPNRKKSLLIIDDDTDVLETIRDGAIDLGVEITTASDPLEALSVIRKKRFDLILSDYQMPILNGQEIFDRITHLNYHPKFIFITSSEPDLQNGPRPDIPTLKKPFTQKELAAIINDALFGVVDIKSEKSKTVSKRPTDSRILIVDDSEENRELMLAFLKSLPHNIDFAENGDIAVKMAKENHYDLILMDVQMPVLDGYQATRLIRDYENSLHLVHTPIVALTANALDPAQELKKSIAAGCDDHLTKPILKNTLFTTIKHHIGGLHEGRH